MEGMESHWAPLLHCILLLNLLFGKPARIMIYLCWFILLGAHMRLAWCVNPHVHGSSSHLHTFGSGLIEEVNCTWCIAGKYQTGSGVFESLLSQPPLSNLSFTSVWDVIRKLLKQSSDSGRHNRLHMSRTLPEAALTPDWFLGREGLVQMIAFKPWINMPSYLWDQSQSYALLIMLGRHIMCLHD